MYYLNIPKRTEMWSFHMYLWGYRHNKHDFSTHIPSSPHFTTHILFASIIPEVPEHDHWSRLNAILTPTELQRQRTAACRLQLPEEVGVL